MRNHRRLLPSAARAFLPAIVALAAFPGNAAAQPAEPRVLRALASAPRFVRMDADVAGSGVHGTATLLIDRATGRTLERVVAGPLSTIDGFDGARAWHADATGMPMVIGNAEARRDALAWAHLFGRAGPERAIVVPLARRPNGATVRIRYAGLSGPIDVTLDRRGRVRSVDDETAVDPVRTTFGAFRSVRGVTVPYTIVQSSPFATWRYHVRAVTFPHDVVAAAFGPPPPPDDVRLSGVATVPMTLPGETPVVAIRIGAGPPLHVLLDSGSTNYLIPSAAARIGLRTVGEDKSGGVGPQLVRERYATVRRVAIGAAVLVNQPFAVVDDRPGPGIDGAIGQELLQRLAVAFDFHRHVVRLARRAAELGVTGRAIPIDFAPSGPEVAGEVDGLRGAIAIDTGSGVALDVMSPFVRKHQLARRYRVRRLMTTGSGIGGATVGYFATARTLRLGGVTLHDVPMVLDTMTTGALADPTQLGNLGVPVLRRFTTVLDERNGRLWLLP
ncbi:MAG TPA: pepsin/retropepsin-like aspartic protease family protein [Candidatus Elarobacter sp.]|jgi:hypothetical protein